MSEFKKKIINPDYYVCEIEKLRQKLLRQNMSFYEGDQPVLLNTLAYNSREFADIIANSIKCKSFYCKPGKSYTLVKKGKKRELIRLELSARIFNGVLAKILTEEFNYLLSDNLYSYRKKKSAFNAVSKFAEFVRKHSRQIKEPKKRGLYVIRKDIHSYSDSIPVGADSVIWSKLKSLLELDTNSDYDIYLWNLIQSSIRPEVISEDGNHYTKLIGLPTGTPVTAFIYNFYGSELDSLCSNINGGFYARYSDDILFAHPDIEIVLKTEKNISDLLGKRGLTISSKKNELIYFNGAGRKSEISPQSEGSEIIQFLGARINFAGEVSLSSRRIRLMFNSLKSRIDKSCKILRQNNISLNPADLCSVINNSIAYHRTDFVPERSAKYLAKVATDRKVLKQIDYFLALMIAEQITDIKGPRSFRKMSRRDLITKYGLKSLCHLRNTDGLIK